MKRYSHTALRAVTWRNVPNLRRCENNLKQITRIQKSGLTWWHRTNWLALMLSNAIMRWIFLFSSDVWSQPIAASQGAVMKALSALFCIQHAHVWWVRERRPLPLRPHGWFCSLRHVRVPHFRDSTWFCFYSNVYSKLHLHRGWKCDLIGYSGTVGGASNPISYTVAGFLSNTAKPEENIPEKAR